MAGCLLAYVAGVSYAFFLSFYRAPEGNPQRVQQAPLLFFPFLPSKKLATQASYKS